MSVYSDKFTIRYVKPNNTFDNDTTKQRFTLSKCIPYTFWYDSQDLEKIRERHFSLATDTKKNRDAGLATRDSRIGTWINMHSQLVKKKDGQLKIGQVYVEDAIHINSKFGEIFQMKKENLAQITPSCDVLQVFRSRLIIKDDCRIISNDDRKLIHKARSDLCMILDMPLRSLIRIANGEKKSVSYELACKINDYFTGQNLKEVFTLDPFFPEERECNNAGLKRPLNQANYNQQDNPTKRLRVESSTGRTTANSFPSAAEKISSGNPDTIWKFVEEDVVAVKRNVPISNEARTQSRYSESGTTTNNSYPIAEEISFQQNPPTTLNFDWVFNCGESVATQTISVEDLEQGGHFNHQEEWYTNWDGDR